VGKPLEVTDIGGGRTSVVCELNQGAEASAIWKGLIEDPPVNWRASIYGFPPDQHGFIDTRFEKCPEVPNATRYVVKALDWRSLALTTRPVNEAITHSARIVSVKAFIKSHVPEFVKDETLRYQQLAAAQGLPTPPAGPVVMESLLPPRNRVELLGHLSHHANVGRCPFCGPDTVMGRSVLGFREHFINCCGCDYDDADTKALALMQLLKRQQAVATL
jgi:hypothetical protein